MDNLERHMARLNDQGERLDVNSLPWLVDEAKSNLTRIYELLRAPRPPKRKLRAILADLENQLKEIGRRVD